MSESHPQLKLFGAEDALSNNQLLLGTSSWTGEGWVGSFYPEGSKPADFLPFYSQRFRIVEIDSTFYRIPAANTVQQWRERTPNGFVFAAKVPRSVTHDKVLVDVEGDLKEFLSVMDSLGARLGPLLLQFPYFNKSVFRGLGFFLERLIPFLENLPKGYKWAVEIRNKNWLGEKFYSVLREHGVALALVDHLWMPRPHEYFEAGDPVTAGFSYIRWIGDRKGVEEQTTRWDRVIVDREHEMDEWIRVIRQILKRHIQIVGFFNNHYAGFAPGSIKLFNEIWVNSLSQGKGAE
jgi:uncharacterized protein YecE (DUF72 family)